MKFIFFPVSENGENVLSYEWADGAMPPEFLPRDARSASHGGRCSVGRVGHGPPKILVGWATMHLAPPIIGLCVR